ncbi:Chromosome instability protein 1 [Candida viswanathii]|uniref:Chromosome instability protein 1 n=1 Tax=Candida viswanathii TaxID=5486 RepID=A0A367YJ35_9ASCO|nr:Chromosome instability protein 1 [Candida viswanathii]
MNEFDGETIVLKKSSQLHTQIHESILELEKLCDTSLPSLPSHDRFLLVRAATCRAVGLINEFEINPKLLDSSLETYIHQLAGLYIAHESVRESVGEIVYNFGKIRGFKIIINYFPSDLYLVNRLLRITKESKDEFATFTGLCWLCTLSLLPFPLVSIDLSLPQTMYNLAFENLLKYSNGSKNQVISLILLSKLLIRNDCYKFFELFFLNVELHNWVTLDDTHKLSYYLTINKILKLKVQFSSHRIFSIYQCINTDILQRSSSSNLNLLYLTKILSKLAISYVQQGEFHNVESIINNLINDILLEASSLDYNLRYGMAKSLSSIVGSLSEPAINYKQQMTDFLLANLDDIDQEMNIAKNHTILLTLGYLSLNKIIRDDYTSRLVEIVHESAFLRVTSQRVDLGSCIRDSSCFIIWSIIKNNRKLSIEQLSLIFNDLIKVLVFDKELVLKKCSIAILQELIGRHGTAIFWDDRFNDEQLGQFIVDFLEVFTDAKLKLRSASFDVIDSLLDKIDLGFLVPTLIDEICDTSGEPGSVECLQKLLAQSRDLPVIGTRVDVDLEDIVGKLTTANRWQYLFVLPVVPWGELERKFSNFEVRHDHNLIKGYLTYLIHGGKMSAGDWRNLVRIIKHNDKTFVTEIGQLLESQDVMIPARELISITRSNVVLSRVIFDFKHWNHKEVQAMLSLMKNPNVDIEIRRNMLGNLSENYALYPVVNELYPLFDDYTTTIQGDVGSKLRFGMLELVRRHHLMNGDIKLKLIRLSGELIDKLRHLAFELVAGVSIIDERRYWEDLFEFYNSLTDAQERVEFWKGCCFTIGSFKGNPKLINQSLIQLLAYGPGVDEIEIWMGLLETPSLSPREQRLKLMVLQMFLKLFQSNFQFHDSLNYNQLFAKCYNLYLSGKNATQAITILKIFYHISTQKSITINLKSKIHQIFTRILEGKFYHKLKMNEILLQMLIDKHLDLGRYQQINWTQLSQNDKQYMKDFLLLDLQPNS